MNALKHAMWVFFALIGLAASGFYYASSYAPPTLNMPALSSTADTIIHQLGVSQFDINGLLTRALQTPFVRHIPSEHAHWLKSPSLVISQADQPSWKIHANQASALDTGKHISLRDNVVIHHDDPKQVLEIRAGSAELDQLLHRGVFKDNVELDQGTSHLRAAILITIGNEKNKLIKATAKGDSKAQAHYWAVNTPEKPPMHAHADILYFYPERHFIQLIGHAFVEQGDNSFSAPEIDYDIQKQRVLSKYDGQNQTTIIIHPEQHP